ncbi:MAG: hypothetical protein R2883_05880 [Caldisericia bacterium]
MPYLWGFVFFLFLLGFPFLILVVSNKQEGWLKIAGWILAGVFVLMLIVASLFSLVMGSGKMIMNHHGMCPGNGCSPSMMGHPGCPYTPGDGFKANPRNNIYRWNNPGFDDRFCPGMERFERKFDDPEALEEFQRQLQANPELREKIESSFFGLPGEEPAKVPPGTPEINPEELAPPTRP